MVGPPALFVLLSPLLALLGFATGWFSPRPIGDAVVLILLGAAVLAVLLVAVLAVVLSALSVVGTVTAAAASVVAYLFSRVR